MGHNLQECAICRHAAKAGVPIPCHGILGPGAGCGREAVVTGAAGVPMCRECAAS